MSKQCPVCDDILTEIDGKFVCESCEYEEPANGTKKKKTAKGGKAAAKGKQQADSKVAAKDTADTKVNAGSTNTSSDGAGANKRRKEQQQEVRRKFDRNHINPGMRRLPKVTVFGWQVGYAKYRYGITIPNHYQSAYKQEMSGSEAFRLLTKIKSANRRGQIETKELLKQ